MNVAVRTDALHSSNANRNVAVGYQALGIDSTDDADVATGLRALAGNKSGTDDIASRNSSLYSNAAGSLNIATGTNALEFSNADDNVATGVHALSANTSGASNIAASSNALTADATSGNDIATGLDALKSNVDGRRDSGERHARRSPPTRHGNSNVALGSLSLSDAHHRRPKRGEQLPGAAPGTRTRTTTSPPRSRR